MAFDWGNAFRGGASGAAAGSSFGPWGSVVGGGLGALGGLFGGGGDEEKDTNKYLDQIPDELKKYLMPYINAGQNSLGKVGGEYDKLMSDPNSIISKIGSGYKESPGYQWRLNQGTNAINNANAAGGMAGTGQHQQQAGELAGNLANQDYQQYLQQALGLYGTGLQGNQGLAEMGLGAGSSLGQSIAQMLMGKAGLNYTRSANQNSLNSDTMSSILGFLSKK